MLSAFRVFRPLNYLHCMNRLAIRISLILGLVTVVLITSVQVYFVHTAFHHEDRQLDQKVQIALKAVSDQMSAYNQADETFTNPVKRLKPDYYVVNVNGFIDAEVLEYFLVSEFQRRGLEMDLEFGIYDCSNDEIVYGKFISFGQGQKVKPIEYRFDKFEEYLYYFGVYFPGRTRIILNNLAVWYFFSGVLFLVLAFFIYSQIIILRQRQLTEIQKDLINNLTHELKTPLAAIHLSADVLSRQDLSQEPGRLQKYSQIIHSKSSDLLHQIDRILLSSERGLQANFHPEPVDLIRLVEEVSQQSLIRISEDHGQLIVECSESKVITHADPLLFKQVLENILDNAIRYSSGPPDIRIKVALNQKQGLLEVADRGVGIPKKFEKRVFSKFFRVPANNIHGVKGFGLGLYHVRKVAKLHGWKATIQPNPGGGTIFRLRFKISQHGAK